MKNHDFEIKVLRFMYKAWSTEFLQSIVVCAAALDYEGIYFGTVHSAKELWE